MAATAMVWRDGQRMTNVCCVTGRPFSKAMSSVSVIVMYDVILSVMWLAMTEMFVLI